jgi:hypothetical protein
VYLDEEIPTIDNKRQKMYNVEQYKKRFSNNGYD